MLHVQFSPNIICLLSSLSDVFSLGILDAAGLYLNKVHGTIWLVLFGATTCGISAGIFWSVEGAIILGYP